MAQDLQSVVPVNPQALISSPDLRKWRRISLGRVEWPGQPARRYLAGGMKLTDDERKQISAHVAELQRQAIGRPSEEKGRFGLIAKLLLTYPIANASKESGAARGEAYREALSDMPAGVLAEAIRRWNRGEAGQEHDYRWAPAPAVLRQVCERVRAPLMEAIADLEALLAALDIERALDPRPLEFSERRMPMLRAIP